MVARSNLVVRTLLKTESSLQDLDRSERGYILTHDTSYLRSFNNARDSVYSSLAALDQMKSPNQNNSITLVKSSVALKISSARNDIAYIDSANSSTPSVFYYDGRKYMLEALQRLREIRKTESEELDQKSRTEQFYQKLTTDTLKTLLIFFCCMTLILFFLLVREFNARIKFQHELKTKLIDLERSHGELTEIAYAASHDLQEPVRKIQVFSDMLLRRIPADSQDGLHLQRVKQSANRLEELISALASLTDLTKPNQEKKLVDLNVLLDYLLHDMDERIEAKQATVTVDRLLQVHGYADQLKILFGALIDNSLKFTREGVKPAIRISGEIMNGYELLDINPALSTRKFYRITCADNGIGFDNQFIKNIFRIYRRLHPSQSQYEGKGIGLAMCRRVMANHEGYIIGTGQPNEGAKFKLFFPIEE